MAKYIEAGIFQLEKPPKIESFAAVAGQKEGEGPLGEYFDEVIEDSHFGRQTWEQAESSFQLEAVSLAIRKAGLVKEDVDAICSGDLINQCIGSTYGLRELEIPYLGIYGACSTMAEGLLIASLLVDGGSVNRAAARYFLSLFNGGKTIPFSSFVRWTAYSYITMDLYCFRSCSALEKYRRS